MAKPKVITVRLTEPAYERAKAAAKLDGQSLNGFCTDAILGLCEYIEEQQAEALTDQPPEG